jgi:predicted nuclease of predicted toxin-antitoxin system
LRFKFDENLDLRLAELFEKAGHQVETVFAEALCGSPDDTIYQVCQSEERCLITLDMDFASPLRFDPIASWGIIVLRPSRPGLTILRYLIVSLLPAIKSENMRGKLWIVEPGRIREYAP